MAGGKLTPRQKMINMMYLVLTALLAMNVSAEILNAFKTVNNSIVNSNTIIMDKNTDTYSKFNDAIADPQTAEKAKKWSVYANEAKSISDAMFDRLEQLKTEIKEKSGLEIVDGEEIYKFDDLDVASRLMIEEGQGSVLYSDVEKFKADLLAVLDPSKFEADGPVTVELVKAKVAEFEKSMAIDLSIPKSTSGNKYEEGGKGWSESNFHMTPSVAAVTILSKMQNDIRSSQAQLVDFCYNQIGSVKVVYDAFEVIASANTNYAMPGDPIEIVAGIGAFSEAAKPTITIAGTNVPLTGGQAIYKTTASGSGERSIPVTIKYTNPAGEELVVEKNIKYTIGTPSGAAVMFDAMNVLYVGVPNPLTISSGSGDEKTKVSINGGGGSLSKTSAGKYVATVTTPTNEATIGVSVDGGKSLNFPVRVKLIPDPISTIGGNKALTISGKGQKATLKAQGAVIPLLENFDFDAKFSVVSYDCYLTSGGELYSARDNQGPYFSSGVNGFFDRAKPKDVIIFDNIKVMGPDKRPRIIPGMTFQII